MRTSIICVGLGGLLALVACGGAETKDGDGNEAAAGETETAAAGGDIRLQAGQWEVTTEIANMSAPGMPEGVGGMVKMAPTTIRLCMTEEQVQKPNADLFTGKQDGNCTSEGFSAAGGRVNGTVTCRGGPSGGDMKMAMDGRFASTSYEMNMKTEMTGATMDMTVRGRRVGDCPAGGQG
jgi:hypothetical protein